MNAKIKLSTDVFTLPDEMWLVVPHTHAKGGIERERRVVSETQVGTNGERVESTNVQIVSDVDERERAEKLANVAKALVVKHLQYTPLGYLANAASLAKLDAGLADLSSAVAQHNRNARYSFAQVEVLRVRILKGELGPNEVNAIAEKLRTELQSLRDAVRSGDAYEFRKVMARAPNLGSLCVGAVKISVDLGINEAQGAIEILRDNEKDRKRATEKGLPIPALIDPASLPLGQLETAIEMIS